MKKRHYLWITCMGFSMMFNACSDNDNGMPKEEKTQESNDMTPPNKIEYDDGTYIKFNVKIGIDKEALDYKHGDLEWFKTNLKTQWYKINARFNELDKKGQLKRIYRFYPDLENIWIYSREDCPIGENGKKNENDFHWRVPDYFDAKGELDKGKVQCCVIYDFVAQEGEGGGGFGDYHGIGNILVIHPTTEGQGDKFTDHFAEGKNGVTSIVHELGHFRGNIDTYTHKINANDNPVSHTAFTPAYGNMNNPYGATDKETSLWNDYEIKVMNAVGAKKNYRLIYKTMRDYFADEIKITALHNGQTITKGININFYDAGGQKVNPNVLSHLSESSDTGSKTIKARKLFWKNDIELYPWTYYDMFLVEVETKDDKKGHAFLPNYFVHEKGLTDKTVNNIGGPSVYELDIEVK